MRMAESASGETERMRWREMAHQWMKWAEAAEKKEHGPRRLSWRPLSFLSSRRRFPAHRVVSPRQQLGRFQERSDIQRAARRT
jgi:hypothetical protein